MSIVPVLLSALRRTCVPALGLAVVLTLSLPVVAGAAERRPVSPGELAPLHNGPADRYLQEIASRIPVRYHGPSSQSALASFHIAPNGAISQARVLGGSASPDFDRAVLEALAEAGTLPPPPTLDGLWATMVFSYNAPSGW